MGRTLVESLRVHEQIQKMRPNQKVKVVLHRGNYPQNTFLVTFEDGASEVITIPPIPKRKVKV